jgi:hypothetical protein
VSDPGTIQVGGEIRRIVILTVGMEACACYLARQLKDCGAEIVLVNQRSLKVPPDSWKYYRRLWKRRGFFRAFDRWLLSVVKRGARPGPGTSGNPDSPYPVLRPDPELVHESWLTVVELDAVNSKAGRARLGELEPDLILLGGAPILRRKTIELARVACINPHCGITPDYAGSSPFDWAIYERRFEDVGYTVHLVEPTVDSGPILHQERIAWDPARSNGQIWPVLAQKMYDRLAEITRALVAGRTWQATPQGTPRVNPPAGLFARLAAERVRRRHADEIRRLFAGRQD